MKKPPEIKIETISQEILSLGFLGIDRRKIKIIYPDRGPFSIDDQFMTVDSVVRRSNDAVAVVAHFTLNNEIYVYLRSCLRPAAIFRNYYDDSERIEDPEIGSFFEIPAGLVDNNERGYGGLLCAAVRELYEETGLNHNQNEFNLLGPKYFSSAGMCAERIWFYEVLVNPLNIEIPNEDGSALEMGAEVIAIPLKEALEAIKNEEILDAKTQMGLMRLAKKFNIDYNV